jgi:hypothetical protein
MSLQLCWIGLFGTNATFVHRENKDMQEAFLQKWTQFSQGDNVIDAAATNIDGFHWRDTGVFQLKWIGLFGANTAYLHLETLNFQ